MSKIEELIEKLCPDGVEYKTFPSICRYIRGITYSKTDEVNDGCNGISVLRANNITLESNTINFEDVKIVVESVRVKPEQWLKKNDILICAGSGSKEHIGKVAFINEDMGYTFGGFMGIIKSNPDIVNARYVFHILTGPIFKNHLHRVSGASSSTINNINNDTWKSFKIPVPPMEIQEEIVRILDNFSELTVELTVELTAELTARKEQLKYYMNKLLSFNENVNYFKLNEISTITRGIRVVRSQLNENEGYPVFQNSLKPLGYYSDYNREPRTTFIITAGGAGEIGFSEERFWSADDCFCFQNLKNVDSKYLYYCLINQKHKILKKVRRSSIPRLGRSDIEDLEIPVPKIEKQKEIVDYLDSFTELIEKFNDGLPAEIKARQKQYEYYRDKLLNFKEKIID